ncbi:hypothetical protein GCM10009660_15700 [Catellatospora bangladeshensis]
MALVRSNSLEWPDFPTSHPIEERIGPGGVNARILLITEEDKAFGQGVDRKRQEPSDGVVIPFPRFPLAESISFLYSRIEAVRRSRGIPAGTTPGFLGIAGAQTPGQLRMGVISRARRTPTAGCAQLPRSGSGRRRAHRARSGRSQGS